MVNVLLQTPVDRLSQTQRAISEHFQKGGSITTVLFVLLGLAATVMVVYLLTRTQQKADPNRVVNDPQRLYRDLLDAMKMPPDQKRMIQVMARDLNLTNPAVVLLSSKRFDDRCAEWLRKSNIKSAALDAGATKAMIAQARAQLFPSA